MQGRPLWSPVCVPRPPKERPQGSPLLTKRRFFDWLKRATEFTLPGGSCHRSTTRRKSRLGVKDETCLACFHIEFDSSIRRGVVGHDDSSFFKGQQLPLPRRPSEAGRSELPAEPE